MTMGIDHETLTPDPGIILRHREAPQRLDWPDVAKGIGILLVVVGHVMGGLIDSTLSLGGLPLREIFLAIYLFHMPLFFLLSGIFVGRRVEVNRTAFLRGIFRNLYYPYLLWSFIQFNIIYAAGAWTNASPSPYLRTILEMPVMPVSQFWFLLVLACMHLVTLLILPRVGAIGILLLAVILRFVSDIFIPNLMLLQGFFDFYIYYAIGVVLAPDGIQRIVRRDGSLMHVMVASILAIALLAVTVLITIDHTTAPIFFREHPRIPAAAIAASAWTQMGIGAGLAMTAVIITWADRARGQVKAVLLYLGRMSLPIYILHVLFAAGTRIILVKLFKMTSILEVLPLLLMAGLAGPLILNAALSRLGVNRQFGLA